jgi:hypothetical protein
MHRPQVVMLQECYFRGAAESVGKGKMFQLLQTFLSPLGYTVTESGEFITAVFAKNKLEVVTLPLLRRQGPKMFLVHSDELKTALLNVHLAYDGHGSENEVATRKELQTLIECIRTQFPSSRLIVAGDTNRVPAKLREEVDECAATIEQLADGLGVLLMPPGHTNVKHHKGTDSDCSPTYADYAINIQAAC